MSFIVLCLYSFCLLENLIHVNNEIWSAMSPCPSSSSLHGHLYTFPLLFHVFVLFFLSLNNPVNLVGAAERQGYGAPTGA